MGVEHLTADVAVEEFTRLTGRPFLPVAGCFIVYVRMLVVVRRQTKPVRYMCVVKHVGVYFSDVVVHFSDSLWGGKV